MLYRGRDSWRLYLPNTISQDPRDRRKLVRVLLENRRFQCSLPEVAEDNDGDQDDAAHGD